MTDYIYGPLVKRSRHRPFTAVTRVRFSYGSLTILYCIWRDSQVVRPRSATPLSTGSNPVHASAKLLSFQEFFYYIGKNTFLCNKKRSAKMCTMCIGRLLCSCTSAPGAEQVPGGPGDLGSSKRTCPLCSIEKSDSFYRII